MDDFYAKPKATAEELRAALEILEQVEINAMLHDSLGF